MPDAVEPLIDEPEPLVVEPDDMLPLVDEPDGVVVVMPPDADGELALPEPGELTVLPDGELVLSPVPLELVAPPLPLLTEPDAPPLPTEPDAPPLPIEPDAPEPDVLGDADGEAETPATCIATWLQRSKSARVMVPAPMPAVGSKTAASPALDTSIFATLVMTTSFEGARCRGEAGSSSLPSA